MALKTNDTQNVKKQLFLYSLSFCLESSVIDQQIILYIDLRNVQIPNIMNKTVTGGRLLIILIIFYFIYLFLFFFYFFCENLLNKTATYTGGLIKGEFHFLSIVLKMIYKE